MMTDMKHDTSYLVNFYKNKVVMALSFVLIRKAREAEVPVITYIKNQQYKYLNENQDVINPTLEHKFLSHNQQELFKELQRTLPISGKNKGGLTEDFTPRDDGLTENNDWTSTSEQGPMDKTPPSLNPQRVFSYENCALKYLQFIESILMIKEEIERKAPIQTSFLQSVLYDEAEYASYKNSLVNCDAKKMSDDSGFGCSQYSKENSQNTINYVSGDVIKVTLQSSNTNHLVANSLKFVLNHVKQEIKLNTLRTFHNWKGSLTEYACDILKECSRYSSFCRELHLNLVFELLEDLWNDRKLAQNLQWELEIHIVNELLTCFEVCSEVMQYMHDKFNHFIKCVAKEMDTSLMAEKMVLLLNLYCSVCGTLKMLRPECKATTKTISEDCDVTRLWQEKWSANDTSREITTIVGECEVTIMDKLVFTATRYPLIKILALQALEMAKECSTIDISVYDNTVHSDFTL
uniref:Uncharacterized protein n=1 Tax=Cuerna arida TaxID=1464854 RepID=A0A1B6GU35_9HEMI